MRKFFKISLVAILAIIVFSFTKKQDEILVYSENKTEKIVFQKDTITWRLLGEIKYVKKKHATFGEIEFPLINTKLKSLAKKTVYLSGFVVPIDSKNYALSKNVFAACFFCGKSGPETIAGLHFKGKTPRIKTDTYVTVKATFRYNETDAEDWIYNLDNVEIVSGL